MAAAKPKRAAASRWPDVRAVAETGVNYISVGALTHSAVAVDIAMDFSPTP